MPIDQSLQIKIASLQEAILVSHPRLPILLKEIHTLLKNDPEIVTLMSEEDISVIVSGLKRQTATELVSSTLKKSSRALSKISEYDL